MITTAATLAGPSLIAGAGLTALTEAGYAAIQDEMISIPGGTFEMGDDQFGPRHEVTLSAFQMSRNLVTNKEYKSWVDALGGRRFCLVETNPAMGWPKVVAMGTQEAVKQYRDETDIKRALVTAALAGERLTWGGVQAFLNQYEIWEATPCEPFEDQGKPGQPVNVSWYSAYLFAFMHGTRLETEAEFEYAASRGGEIRERDSSPRYMIGSVRTWKMDWHGDYPEGSQVNPTSPIMGPGKALRDAARINNNPGVRRVSFCPDVRYGFVGFRLVRPQDSPG
ncbi:MAG: SUMF1/EgtB/PvdO family nonheme iron enzyme [Deltaproteobacteria bacterium]|nr:SUMF1/EgtB/PvdO family nonheme iron enzyme [Deltaproteobacteria bacterium]MBI4223769.1 SUMF1/EgtB/PvdO family nonheme iron enzyme [Deltaproteobacteria bacterium]